MDGLRAGLARGTRWEIKGPLQSGGDWDYTTKRLSVFASGGKRPLLVAT